MNIEKYSDYLVNWLEEQRSEQYKMTGYVIGISGGIDSAVVAHLLAKTNAPVHGLILPSATTSQSDIEHAKLVAKNVGIDYTIAPIAPTYDTFIETMQPLFNNEAERQNVIAGNVQARMRMIALYAYAQSHKAVVVGTDNMAEWHMGYFTKFGDGGVDVVPLVQLTKGQVYEMAKYLGVPQAILDKAPSAGLWIGQTDEDEMGVSYAEIDAYLESGLNSDAVNDKAMERINFWHNRSHHKRMLAPAPKSMAEL
ncbi:MAG: NAD(+) synthase [Gammaproteobacteria bacterium]|nr:MAG: NAD(+) synthase [Gammaproteobacteria bacterium]